jgi:sterol desaturase/sphingolipid hydroxylase (fatty acid hydroxylase superfamily)
VFTIEIVNAFLNRFLWWAGLATVFGIAEYLWPAHQQSATHSRLHNLVIVFVVSLLFVVLEQIIARVPDALIVRGLVGLVIGDRRPATVAEIVGSTIVYAIVWDFFQYWWHRAEHTFALLWPVHALHHDDEKMNSTTSVRHTFWSGMLGYFAVHVPTIMICGVNLLTVYGATVLFTLWGFFNHANVRLNLGTATWIISGPQWHRLHHGQDPEYYNKNFAAFFPVIDLMFGTYLHPGQDEFPRTGLSYYRQGKIGLISILRDIFGLAHPVGGFLSSEDTKPRLSK